jgi:hypothetical protein
MTDEQTTDSTDSTTSANGAGIVPDPPKLGKHSRSYGRRFGMIYAGLGIITALGIAGFVLAATDSNSSSKTAGWSTWRPPAGTTSQMAREIADHVSHEYHLNATGTQLLAVVASPPIVTAATHKILISNIALQSNAKTNKSIQVVSSGGTWLDNLCGLSPPNCSIPSGKATTLRGRLVRREALEVALYTFKFVPSINTIVALMPPPTNSTQNTALYLQRADLQKELSEPLAKTLPLAKPPLPTEADPSEAATIDKLTLPAIYKFQYQQLQDASALLVLNQLKLKT